MGCESSGLMCKVHQPPCWLLRALQLASPIHGPPAIYAGLPAYLPMRLCRDTTRHGTT